MLTRLQRNWRSAFREALECALAAGLAWWLGIQVFGAQHTPLFAAITAVISLAPGLPSHSRQALGLLLGVVVGIAIGEIALATADGAHPAVLALVVFCAIMAGVAFQVQPIIGIQAGVSAIIVLVEGQGEQSYVRVVDAMIGGCVALVFSQVLLTPDPFAILRRTGDLFTGKAKALQQAIEKCRQGDAKRGEVHDALRAFDRAAMSLEEQLDYVERIASRTLRGRMNRKKVATRVGQWRECAEHLRLSLDDVAHGLLAPEGEASSDRKLDEASRWIAAGEGLAKGSDARLRSVAGRGDAEKRCDGYGDANDS